MSNMVTPKHCVILHAGTSESWETDPSHQREIEKILRATVADAGSRLSSGATALDVVQFAVTVLEDCAFFNAGKGAVLNEDGEHEVYFRHQTFQGSYITNGSNS